MTWTLYRLREGSRVFEIVGLSSSWEVDVWEGAMKGDVLHGLRALELPMAGRDLVNAYRIATPRRAPDGSVNMVPHRRFVVFESQTAPRFVLCFSENVPRELLDDLRQAFRGPQVLTEGDDHEEHQGEQLAAAKAGPVDGRPGVDPDAARDAAQHGHPRRKGYGSQGRVGVDLKIPRKRRPTKRKRTKP